MHLEGNPSCLVLRYLKSSFLEVFSITEHHAMKAYLGSGGIAPRSLDLGTRWN
jgi:hypothetical protein